MKPRYLNEVDYQPITKRIYLNGLEVAGVNYRQEVDGDIHFDVTYLPTKPFDFTVQTVTATVPAGSPAEAVGRVWFALSEQFGYERIEVRAVDTNTELT